MLTDEERKKIENVLHVRADMPPSGLLTHETVNQIISSAFVISDAALRLDAELDFATTREDVLRGLLDETNDELAKARTRIAELEEWGKACDPWKEDHLPEIERRK